MQGHMLSSACSLETQAALFPLGRQQLWQQACSISVPDMQHALLERAQCPELAERICFKPHEVTTEMLKAIASKPNVVIIGADGGDSVVRTSLSLGHHTYTEEVSTFQKAWRTKSALVAL